MNNLVNSKMYNNTNVSASFLSADFLNLSDEIKRIEESGADFIHADIMDGHFVPNLTFGPDIIYQIKNATRLPVEAHLMISNPESCIDQYIKAGADTIIFHTESCVHIDRMVSYIKSQKRRVGIAINPSTCQSNLDYILNRLDLVLVMTVNPGFGGQTFLFDQIRKIVTLSNLIKKDNLHLQIEVDGGINKETAKLVKNAGAQILVAGSYIFKSDNYTEQVQNLKNG